MTVSNFVLLHHLKDYIEMPTIGLNFYAEAQMRQLIKLL
jgi:hypothetical protein